ncbi:MAG TPA: tetratricopeptide repeat protein [Polyangiaceae bacterium]|nr:tetratricopeptide repeat protein [Polyangiaceae bacterium]
MRGHAFGSVAAVVALIAGCQPAKVAPGAVAKPAAISAADLPAPARLARANQRFELSAYKEAEAEFRALLSSPEGAAARLGLGQVLVKTGRASEAISVLSPLLSDPARVASAALFTARAQQALGLVRAAEATLRAVPEEHSSFAVQLELGSVLLREGRRADAEPVLMTIVSAYNDDRIQDSDGAAMALVGRAAQLLRSPKDANQAYEAAERALPGDTQTLLFRCSLFLEKYDPGHAEEVLNEILAKAPAEPEALQLLARVKLAQALDFDEAERLARLALSVNPKSGAAYAILVGISLRDGDLERAEQLLNEGSSADPGSLELMSLRVAQRFLADDQAGVESAKRAVFQQNPQYSQLYSIVSEFADWEHRYDEIVRMMREAVAIDNEDGVAYAELGLNLIRAGDDAGGVSALRRAFALDPYNVRVFNTLNLYEKTIAADYVTVEHPPFRFRYRKDERAILERYVPALLNEAWTKMVKAYGFTPETPIGVELYAERQNFAIRTGGLPETAIQGVCFGRTLAAMSPKYESFNLGMTLWHELSHVFHIQLSKSHVPRWFTEGLAEYETIIRRPEWAREQDPDLYQALRSGRLPAVANMTRAFTRAEELNDVATAYYASSQILSSWAGEYGMPKLSELLRGWGAGRRTPELLREVLGKPPEALDQEFRAYLAGRLSRYSKQFVPVNRAGSIALAQAAVEHSPDSAQSHTTLARALLRRGRGDRAKLELTRALALDPSLPDARFLDAQLSAHEDPVRAVTTLQKLIADGKDGYAVEMLLAQTLAANDEASTKRALEAATRLDPSQASPFYTLADLAEKTGDSAGELSALRALAGLEQHEPKVYRRLLSRLIESGAYGEAAQLGEAALFADVAGLTTHLLFGEALARTGNMARAQFELESATLCEGSAEELAEAHARLAELYVKSGKRALAKQQAALARKLDAHNARLPALPR